MIYHVGRALVTECLAVVRQVLIADTDQALSLRVDEGIV